MNFGLLIFILIWGLVLGWAAIFIYMEKLYRRSIPKLIEDMRKSHELQTTNNISENVHQIADYDCGIINDYGGGNVEWWQDYMRAEIERCNDYWREQLNQISPR